MTDTLSEWEKPYIPPEGIVPECLLPDGCASWDDPIMSRPLQPLAKFDRAELRRVDGSKCVQDPKVTLTWFMSKHCAGLAYRYRPDIDRLREAFRTGRFTTQHKIALDWAFAGMRVKYVFPGLITGAELPIFEVARCFWTLFGGCSYGTGPWLNQWADDPSKPHPSSEAIPLAEAVRRWPHGEPVVEVRQRGFGC